MENQTARPSLTDALYRFLGQLDTTIRDIVAALPAGAWLLFALVGAVLGVTIWLLLRARSRARDAAAQARAAAERTAFEARLAEANRALDSELGELRGRLAAMAETSSARHNELAGAISSEQLRLSEALTQRLDLVTARLGDGLATVSHRLGENIETVSQRLGSNLADATQRLGSTLAETQSRNADSLSKLYERLALIDQAGASLSELSNQVVTLKDVLANKQMRGAFGQVRMEAIIEDSLPRGAYEFQATLSNGSRPDCLVRLPSAPAPLVIDAKFPLEGFEALRIARTPEEVAAASSRVREAIGKHVDAIAGKYLIAGETQDTALMFVPSEQVYAELHERFTDLVQKSHRARVVIVSPNVLMLAVQTMQAILKDVRMREQAGLIQREVGLLLGDVGRLAERVRDLEKHFTLASKDVEKILASTDKIRQRGEKIDAVDVAEPPLRLAAGE